MGVVINTCNKCKMTFINNNISTCPICNEKILKKEVEIDFKDVSKIPFTIDEKECLKSIKKSRVPFIYKQCYCDENIIKNLKKLYVPALLFNFKVEGDILLDGVVENTISNGKRKYVKKDVYDIKSSCSANFDDLLVSCSSIIDTSNLENIEPFNYEELDKIDLNNENIEYFKTDMKLVNKKSLDEFIKAIESKLHNYDKITTKKITINKRIGKYKFYLVPIYFLNINNNILYVNGQTGMISKKIPYSKIKLTFIFLFLSIIYFSLLVLIFKVIL